MDLRLWNRTPRAVAELRAEVRRLAASVERLQEVQRKEAEQVKKLRQAVHEGTAAARKTSERLEALAAELRRAGEARRAADRERRQMLERIDHGLRIDSKWRKIFNNQVSALVRHVCLPLGRLQPPLSLNARRFRLRSQNEEDGMLFALLEHAGWGGRRFVEIGSGKSGGNAAALARDCGWAGLMIELSAAAVASARKKFAGNRNVAIVAARVTPENVNALLEEHGYGRDIDVLSIDIDSYDYWILEALRVPPRILILEYNALFGPERRVTIPLGQPLERTPKGYHGASLAALAALAGRRGYRLVACENAGVNAFFLRGDVATEVPGVLPGEAFMPFRSRTDLDDGDVPVDIYAVAAAEGLPLVEV